MRQFGRSAGRYGDADARRVPTTAARPGAPMTKARVRQQEVKT